MTTPETLLENRHAISDENWQRIESLFPTYTTGRPSKLSNRDALNAILWQTKTGVPWRDLPAAFGSHQTVYSRYRKWTDSGLFEQIFKLIRDDDDPDMENVSLDSTTIRVHQRVPGHKKAICEVENQAIGISAGGHTTKIHAIVDGLGNPFDFILTGGQVHDSRAAQPLISRLKLAGVNVIADKAYGSQTFRSYLEAEDGTYTIPPKSNAKEKWPVDYYVYRERHLIENFFNQLKNYWRIATRYDKLAHVYLQRVYLVATLIRLK
jgi:transposase